MGVGGELGGAATTMWRRLQRIDKHGGRTSPFATSEKFRRTLNLPHSTTEAFYIHSEATARAQASGNARSGTFNHYRSQPNHPAALLLWLLTLPQTSHFTFLYHYNIIHSAVRDSHLLCL